ncbi:MAG TPA: GNAT family N-acetyltransferase [Acidimicrobiia bacterium]
MLPSDWPEVAGIYREGIDTGDATFETSVPEWEAWDSGHLAECRLVCELDGRVAAWTALSAVSTRPVYRGVAEHSIYVSGDARGRGVGSDLLEALVEASEEAGFWTLQTAIFPDNEASIALHTRFGFRVVGRRERLGLHHGRWRDVLLMERRSVRVGS